MEFKEFLMLKRKEKGLTIRGFASLLGISPAFLCDLESGNRAFPANSKKYPDLLKRIIEKLELNSNDASFMSKLADESMLSKDKIALEVKEYLQNVPLAQQALRKAQENNVTDEQWNEFIRMIERKN